MARSLIKSMGMPSTFWGKAVRTAVDNLNRSPTRSLHGITPYEVWLKKKPAVDYFRTFGCVTHVKLVGAGVTKLSDRSVAGVFLGYEPGMKEYRVYDPAGKRLYITGDVHFEEDRRWDWSIGDSGVAHDHSGEFTVVYSDTGERTCIADRAALTWCHHATTRHAGSAGRTENARLLLVLASHAR